MIEAGGKDSNPLLHIPGAYIKLFGTKADWQFWTIPQPHVNNRKIYLPRGKTLGGSSSTNAMAYVRGNKADYDHWASLGNDGWDYGSVKKYFLKSEGNEQTDQLDEGYHSSDGPLNVTFGQHYKTPFCEAFIQAGSSLGLPLNRDYNGKKQEGIGRFQFTIKNAARHSAADAFLKPAMARPNLTVMTSTVVSKVLIEGKKAIGVEVIQGQNTQKIHASTEVVLSGGAFNSPQLLMLSGIGPGEELKARNIEVKHELPGVGKNLQDHLFYPVSCTANERSGLNHGASIGGQLRGILQYYLSKKGPFTIGPLEAVAFFNTDDISKTTNFQFHFAPIHPGSKYGVDFYDIRTFASPKDGFTILPSLLHPKSRGTVTLSSADPKDTPRIDPNFFSESEDLETMVKGGKIAMEMLESDSFKPYVDQMVLPHTKLNTDEEWKEHIKKSVETIYHPVGTCKMGNDDQSVVDDQLRIHGIEGLRVIDGSIMPTIVSGNINAPIYMIAEKGAEMLLS